MGDKADLLKQLGLPDNVSNAIETGLKYSSLVSDVFSAYSTGKNVLQMFGLIEGDHSLQDIKDELDTIEKKIDTALYDLETEILGAARQQMRTEIADKLAEATTSVKAAQGYVKAPNDQQQQAVFTLAIRDSANAVTALEDDAYWTQVFSPRVFYDHPHWISTLLPPDAPNQNLVFDYRCALPTYLTAVLARLVVLTAADQTFKSQLVSEIADGANRLKGIHDRILGAFTPIRAPTYEEMHRLIPAMDNHNFYWKSSRFPPPPPSPFGSDPIDDPSSPIGREYVGDQIRDNLLRSIPGGPWRLAGFVFGIVETYTGTANQDNYPQQEISAGHSYLGPVQPYAFLMVAAQIPAPITNLEAFGKFYDMFVLKHELRTRWQAASLYRQIGLSKLWDTITKLYGMLQQTPPDIPVELRKYARLSMRDAHAACPQWLKIDMKGYISLNQMCGQLNVPKPFTLSKFFSS